MEYEKFSGATLAFSFFISNEKWKMENCKEYLLCIRVYIENYGKITLNVAIILQQNSIITLYWCNLFSL